jgi:16S rRNA (cytosine1402-N4)-methyltransferase
VNDEMADIDAALAWLPDAIRDDGTVVTLSYHSGEDRRVKHALRGRPRVSAARRLPVTDDGQAAGPWHELTRKVVVPSDDEAQDNPRARSARLRAFRRKSR